MPFLVLIKHELPILEEEGNKNSPTAVSVAGDQGAAF